MLSEHIARADLGYAGLLMGAEEFYAIGETAERYELINGVVVMSPSPTPRHWRFVREILRQLDAYCGPEGSDPYADIDLYVEAMTVFRPDLCVFLRSPAGAVPSRLSEPPDLVVEISSPGNKSYDLKTKRDAYEKFGVKEYWSIDPYDPNEPPPPGMRVRAWWLDRGRLVDLPVNPDSLASRAVAGFSLDLRPLGKLAGK